MLAADNYAKKRKLEKYGDRAKLYMHLRDKSELLSLRSGYTIIPSAAEIFYNQFVTHDLMIKNGGTAVLWKGLVNLKDLKAPLSQLIDLGPKHIQVYPNQQIKPLEGKQLNKTCFVTFRNLKQINKKKLLQICQRNETELLTMDMKRMEFTVEIKHFTLYRFDEVDSDQEQELDGKKEKKGRKQKDLFEVVSNSNSNKVIAEGRNSQMSRKSMSMGMQKKEACEKEAVQYSQSRKDKIEGEGVKLSFQTVGVNCNVSSKILSKQNVNIQINHPQYKMKDTLNTLVMMLNQSQRIESFITNKNQDDKFYMKKIITLYLICFQFKSCFFQFVQGDGKIQIRKTQNPPHETQLLDYLKNWLEWVCNQSPLLAMSSNQLLRNLLLRKTAEQSQICLKQNRMDDAQFLASIEDENYRSGGPPLGLCLELKKIALGGWNLFENTSFSWINQLSIQLWYCSFNNPQIKQNIIRILNLPVREDSPDYNIERHLLRLFFKQQFSALNLFHLNYEDKMILWFIVNKNRAESFNNNFQHYHNFRYSLVQLLILEIQSSQATLQLVTYDEELKEKQKVTLIYNFMKKYPVEAEKYTAEKWGHYGYLLHQMNAIKCYINKQYFRALQLFQKCDKVTNEGKRCLQLLVLEEAIIGSFHRMTLKKSLNLLKQMKVKEDDIGIAILFLSISLQQNKDQIKKDQLEKLISFCSKASSKELKQRMLDTLFESLLKSSYIRKQLKNPKSEIQKKLNSIFTAPEYQLKLKFAKLKI